MLSKVFLTFLTALFVKSVVSIVHFSTQADIAIIQNPIGNGDSRLYYQPSSGAIVESALTSPFDNGGIIRDTRVIVPATQTHTATPIVATILGPFTEESPTFCSKIHVFFLSPTRVLSEYYWAAGSWKGGPQCKECLTSLGAKLAPDVNALSATIDTVNNVIGVVFVDANNNATLSEAVKRNGTWAIWSLREAR